MQRVLVFGTFDILHPGHLYFLREARKYGDALIVVVTPSRIVQKLKGQAPLFGDTHRLATVRLLSVVDRAVLGDRTLDTFRVLKKWKPAVICIGHDQKELHNHITRYCKIVGMKPKIVHIAPYDPKRYKSQYLKRRLKHGTCLHCQL